MESPSRRAERQRTPSSKGELCDVQQPFHPYGTRGRRVPARARRRFVRWAHDVVAWRDPIGTQEVRVTILALATRRPRPCFTTHTGEWDLTIMATGKSSCVVSVVGDAASLIAHLCWRSVVGVGACFGGNSVKDGFGDTGQQGVHLGFGAEGGRCDLDGHAVPRQARRVIGAVVGRLLGLEAQ